ncbi:MAG: coenzyme F420-0:L-glutamate ligase, partial [Candidatus Fermentibacteria bacterium]
MNQKIISARGTGWERIPIKTRLILKGDNLLMAIEEGLEEADADIQPDDILFVSEKAVGASQGRYF